MSHTLAKIVIITRIENKTNQTKRYIIDNNKKYNNDNNNKNKSNNVKKKSGSNRYNSDNNNDNNNFFQNFRSFLFTNKLVVTRYITSKSRYASLNSNETVANHT